MVTEFGRNPVVDLTVTAGDHAEDVPAEGLVHILLDTALTSTIKAGDYYYFIDRIVPGAPDDIRTILPPIDDYKDKLKIREK